MDYEKECNVVDISTNLDSCWKPRSFIHVTEKIIGVIEYIKETPKQSYLRRINLCNLLGKKIIILNKNHLMEKLYKNLVNEETIDKMTLYCRYEYVLAIRKLQNEAIYLDPMVHHILWEKLARLCAKYLNPYSNTTWALKVSKIIRDVE